jgi:tol-pal system protein YbgF
MSNTPSKPRALRLATVLLIASASCTPAFAVNKDMVQLQTQVQQLLDAVARLQQSNDERMGVLKDLVQQSADSVNRLSVTVDTLQKQLVAQQTASGSRSDQVSGQVQALNDSLDEIKARMIRLEKVLNDVQSQQQSMSGTMQSLPQPGGTSTTPSSLPPSTQPGNQPQTQYTIPGPSAIPGSASSAAPTPARTPAAPAAAPVTDLYRGAYTDYMAAKYLVATAEFNDIIKSYPDDTLAGNAYYYLGEIDYRAGRFSAAVRDYDKVLEQFPDNNKVPAAHLHKGQALFEQKQTEAGIRELRALIQRFPNSPESTQARSKLNALGVRVRP